MGRPKLIVAAAALACAWSVNASAYSVLAHEACVDALWTSHIRPMLQHRFPRASADDITDARAYAYGGAVIQDLGYYPFGSRFFSNLLHYVRSGDFVETLVAEARDLNEYAFALGALAHYAADNDTYLELLERFEKAATPMPAALRADIEKYGASIADRSFHTRKDRKRAARFQESMARLNASVSTR